MIERHYGHLVQERAVEAEARTSAPSIGPYPHEPLRVEELAQRNCLTHSYFGRSLWNFSPKDDGTPVSVAVGGNVSTNGSGPGTTTPAAGGAAPGRPVFRVLRRTRLNIGAP